MAVSDYGMQDCYARLQELDAAAIELVSLGDDDVCCCGEAMSNHSSPYDCGHSPVSALEHALGSNKTERNKVLHRLATLQMEQDWSITPCLI